MYELNRIKRKEYYTKTDTKNLLSIQQSQVNEIFERVSAVETFEK